MTFLSKDLWPAAINNLGCRQLVLLLCLIVSTPALATEDQPDLNALVDVAINYSEVALETRRLAIEQIRPLLANNQAPLLMTRAKFGIADAYFQYQQGDLNAAIEAIQLSLKSTTLANQPDLYIRSQSLHGGLLLTIGKRLAGLELLESLFEQDLSEVDQVRIENLRVNYASALVQNGRIQQASEAYEQALLYALSNEDDVLGLSAASNYISLLRDQGMSAQAGYWLDRLRPAMERKPNVMATAALKIYDYGLMLNRGDSNQAVTQLESFLARPEPTPNLVRAHGEELYADALLAEGQLEASLAAAQRALTLLEGYPVEQPEAIMAIVRSAIALKQYDIAKLQLARLDHFEISRPANIAEEERLRLDYALRTGDLTAAAAAFTDFQASNQTLVDFLSRRQADYYGEKLDKQRTEMDLKLAREEQALLSAEAATQKEREKSLRQQRGFIIGISIFAVLSGIALIYFNARRQLQSRLRDNLREQNASLSALVESKSQDLVQKVTEQSQLKEALAERRHMETIGQIAGNVAHDFNNVLQVVSSTNDLLAGSAKHPAELQALAASNQSVRSGSRTVGQLLAYSRNQQLETSIFNVASYLEETEALFRSAIGDVNQLKLQVLCDDAWVNLDSSQLTAAIINLLSNASDALDIPGEIGLTATIHSTPADAKRSLQIQVLDHGRGMDSSILQEASRPYFTTKPGGTGLGLSSVYGFALQSGGEALIESKINNGTRAYLRFPLYEGAINSVEVEPSSPQSLQGSRVLIVEDNSLIAQTLKTLLEREGATSHWVSAADQAQAALAHDDNYDLMLSDVKIPGPLDGFGLAQWVREQHPKIRIGMMSGYGPSVDDALDVPVLGKPFSAEELADYLRHRQAAS